MTRHVADESLPDLASGLGSDAERSHAAACPACASRVAGVRSALQAARSVEVPEPSPLYWEAMRRSVGRRIDDEPRARASWAWLASLAGAAAVVAVVVLDTGRTRTPSSATPAPRLAAWSALPAAEDDPSLVVLEGFASEEAGLAALDDARDLGTFLAGLTDEDDKTLADSLRGDAKGGES
jgi:hypothetical protein